MFATQEASRFLRFANGSYTRRVRLSDEFRPNDLVKVTTKLLALCSTSIEPAILDIDSTGGDFQTAHVLSGLIPQLRSPIYGLVVGNCYSSAFHILQSCPVRLALPIASLAFHNNYKNVVIETTADMDIEIITKMLAEQKIERARSREVILSAIQRRNPSYSRNQLLQMMREGKPMTADSALSKGFIDEIVRY